MSVSFDWDFEEEEPDPSDPSEGLTLPSERRRNWLFAGVMLLTLLGVGGLLVRGWVNQRLGVVEQVEAKLREIAELELEHIKDGDAELFRLIQDPIVFRWSSQQMTRYIPDDGAASLAPAPGLVPADCPTRIRRVRVVGRTGRVELVQWFQSASPPVENQNNHPLTRWFRAASLLRTVCNGPAAYPFHVTWFYRLDEGGNWYHTPPPNAHLGVPHSWYSERLEVHATEVEAEALHPVVGDLVALVIKGCHLLDCDEQKHYTLNFDDTPTPQLYGDRWSTPALYLAGIPQNQAAHGAWSHAFKLWLAGALAQSHSSGTDRVIYHHLVARFQAELELIEAPATPDIETLTQVLNESKMHTLQDLWEAQYDPDDAEANRLLDAEVAALLSWIEDRVGTKRLFELLPALRDYRRLGNALLATYQMPSPDYEIAWFSHLLELTGMPALPSTTALRLPYQALRTPPMPQLPDYPPGDQVALVCNSRVWISDADGSGQTPLTTAGWSFSDLHWSPDGRWLLTTWWHGSEGGALYLLAADGSGGRLLIDNPSLYVFPIGWSPDSRQVIYNVYRGAANNQVSVWSTDIETGETHPLPGVPTWSPDGQHLVYVAESPEARGNVVWLSDADWENPRPLVDLAELGPQGAWSPDSSRLALTLLDEDPAQNAVVLYELASGSITPLVTIADVAGIAASSVRANLGDIIVQDADPDALGDRPLQSLWPLGWSADGNRLLVWAQASADVLNVVTPAVLAMVPLDGSSPRMLAYGNGGFYGNTSWSPTNPDRLTFSWPSGPRLSGGVSYLYDLNAGPLYTAPQNWNTAWSPDGDWLAFSGQNPLTIVSQEGHARFSSEPGSSCTALAWNPVADLSALGQAAPVTLTLASSENTWHFENVHIEQNQRDPSLHVWGEVVNHSGENQRITNFVPFLQDKQGQPVNRGQSVFFPIDFRVLIRSVSLADGQSLPFDFTIHLLPRGVWLEGETEIVVHVVSEPAEPMRSELDIIPGELDLAGQIDALYVSGAWENAGADLNEHAAVVVTLYGDEGQVLGWGWSDETDPVHLAGGRHNFKVQITLSETVTDLDQASSYKVQLFAH
jgi:hypothetical protein